LQAEPAAKIFRHGLGHPTYTAGELRRSRSIRKTSNRPAFHEKEEPIPEGNREKRTSLGGGEEACRGEFGIRYVSMDTRRQNKSISLPTDRLQGAGFVVLRKEYQNASRERREAQAEYRGTEASMKKDGDGR